MPSPPDRLDDLAADVLARLRHAAEARTGAWRTPMLATVAADGAPSLRTVILRGVEAAGRTLTLYTDRRSDKAAQIAREAKVELGFWDPEAGQQLRVAGIARVAVDGPAVERGWQALPAQARAIYLGATAPGTPLGRPGSSGIAVPDPRREVFAVIDVVWARWDWLWLGPDGHRRARAEWEADGSVRWAWVEP